MGSYGDESYRYTPRPKGGSFFKPKPTTPPSPSSTPSSSSGRPATSRAASVRPPVTTQVVRPTGKINLIVGYDTTGSMGAYRENMQDKSQYLYEEITNLLPDLAGDMDMLFVGVGDHCDGSLMIQRTGFSKDALTLKNHIVSILNTGGGDMPEAYECLLREINTWPIEGTNTILLLVADSVPHGITHEMGADSGCPDGVSFEDELALLKEKLRAFYFISCAENTIVKRHQRRLVEDEEHFIELGGDFRRLTNVVHAIVAKELGALDTYLTHLKTTRGAARADEIQTLLKTNVKTKNTGTKRGSATNT